MPSVVLSNASLFDPSDAGLLERLLRDQPHLFVAWSPSPTAQVDQKRRFAKQIRTLHASRDIFAYRRKATALLQDSRAGTIGLGCVISTGEPYVNMDIPSGVTLTPGSNEFHRLEELGARNAASCVFVLVAGGLGERLGYPGIKVSLCAESITHITFLEMYVKSVLALQHTCRIDTTDASLELPLCIMTSDDTHGDTISALTKYDRFGASPSQIFVVKQEKVPCLGDGSGNFVLKSDFELLTKPHGHGDVHALLSSSGLAARWVAERRRWICFFQDTNALSFRGIATAIGVSADQDYDVNSLCVSRQVGEACGGLASLSTADGCSSIVASIEYNVLREYEKTSKMGSPSPYPGSINVLVFKLRPYEHILSSRLDFYPEFINPKYADDSKQVFKSPTRLEALMQDCVRLYESSPDMQVARFRVGFTTLPRKWCFSPVKNSLIDGSVKPRGSEETAKSCEQDIFDFNANVMRMCGCVVERGTESIHPTGPHIVLSPSFGATLAEIKSRFPKPASVFVSSSSSLVLQGNVVIQELFLNGRLEVVAAPGARVVIKKLKVTNKGTRFTAASETSPPQVTVRGYDAIPIGQLRIHATTPGDVVVDRPW